ncbi:Mitotic checkpoint serine/threonine-protein kinase BUB1 [Morella rubra]|uniref:Mitotic checkpoint serine/threonine-protein kinase BUB1 n=1 Tax=Morella rubra TaxID=262757 RepID=A0A6A1VAN1_9ROSI|nr:Mitotic checkpoint serine/threonine-protein kinase BUB1 [Morella rubra]
MQQGRVYYTDAPNKTYSTQFAKDVDNFLNARAKELIGGDPRSFPGGGPPPAHSGCPELGGQRREEDSLLHRAVLGGGWGTSPIPQPLLRDGGGPLAALESGGGGGSPPPSAGCLVLGGPEWADGGASIGKGPGVSPDPRPVDSRQSLRERGFDPPDLIFPKRRRYHLSERLVFTPLVPPFHTDTEAMTVIFPESRDTTSDSDPLLPWLWSIKKALEADSSSGNGSGLNLGKLLSDCIATFRDNDQYRNDVRFLKIWFLYMDVSKDFESVFIDMVKREICVGHSLLYVCYASFLESKGKLYDAHIVYQSAISRNAKPVELLKRAHALFLDRMSELVNACLLQKTDDGKSTKFGKSQTNPWSASTMRDLLKKLNPQIMKYEGYHSSAKAYPGKVALSSLQHSSRNKIIEIGGKKYQIKGCAGQGGFAQVYKAHVHSNPDEVVALKIQKPAFLWEFYMYRQLDQRISDKERSSFGFAHRMHLYSDCSILVCDYLAHGTLQDAINSYVVTGKSMEEVLCIYYAVEMLYMLETLHGAGIIHGDFKPDNLLIRYARGDLTEDGYRERIGPWHDQGLCLVDWGRGIDRRLFPDNAEFKGDCRTSGFRCIEMQENKPWTFQANTYGLCVIVHMMLHNSYMEIEKKSSSDGDCTYLPKSSFKRYWNVELWKNFFTKLLNISPGCDDKLLQNLRESFQDYMCSNPQLIKKLKELLVKQRASLCSA